MNGVKRLKNIAQLFKRNFIVYFNRFILRKHRFEIMNRNLVLLEEMLKLHTSDPMVNCSGTAEGIIFSMDRALQLHALLSTYFEKVKNPVPIFILWRASSGQHKSAYDEVFSLFATRNIYSIYQKNQASFKDQLLAILANIKAEKVFFLVDDIIFI